jgi:hypothetical protein
VGNRQADDGVWTIGDAHLIGTHQKDGVTLGNRNLRRSAYPEDPGITDEGHVYLVNGTGERMIDPVAQISDITPNPATGNVDVEFLSTRIEYPDLGPNEGGAGPDPFALDGTERLWGYTWDGTDETESYVESLTFTVTVSWLTDP